MTVKQGHVAKTITAEELAYADELTAPVENWIDNVRLEGHHAH